ncbi:MULTISPECIES: nucleoside deaminase [Mesonia]|uniref:Guanine deaminase n=1 Tax=Mesonia oceanica TaxID=2687242 RepID=A0AC61YB09_9FLAO|nr:MULTISPECIES: nucleoside deaminase [Mesonia]MAN26032.1 tRNA-specific adenosine deaminase [Mesonia sp.]MAQ39866.1 tRNA-specific adenosine deaminase [Mesonia sp.]MBJ98156.1 tRNA-specific adenosine deaminase [Flavobacteriaceae bacterium]VVV01676.1 Guanine deaminase [Mesonia oceanica]|tara:strand:+ start:19423 stop:19899 length:477 start_codon:yes stop_codon:yes gene_type:complete
MTELDKKFMRRAIELAQEGMNSNAGGPFGAVVVRNEEIIAEGYNKVTSTNDPTAHAEVTAIRKACEILATFQLEDCILYTSCEPCPMCLGAIYWARFKKVFYALEQADAATIGFDDEFIYQEIDKKPQDRKITFEPILREEALPVFQEWDKKENRTDY